MPPLTNVNNIGRTKLICIQRCLLDMNDGDSRLLSFLLDMNMFYIFNIKQMNFEEIMLNFVKLYEGTIHV